MDLRAGLTVCVYCAVWVVGCDAAYKYTPTSGEITVACEEDLTPVISAEADSFMRAYPKATVKIVAKSTQAAIADFLNGAVSGMVVTRTLDLNEKSLVQQNDIRVFTQDVAFDGLAFIVNSENPAQSLSMEELERIWNGSIMKWSDLVSGFETRIELCIDQRGSGAVELLRQRFGIGNLDIETGTVEGQDQHRLLSMVATRAGAIGFVSSTLINDAAFKALSSKINVLKITEWDWKQPVVPHPAYVLRGDYPIQRTIRYFHREKSPALATGFGAFLASNPGQWIFLQYGAVPAVNPVTLKYRE